MTKVDKFKDSICSKCVGCNKLDLESFKGIYLSDFCDNFTDNNIQKEK